MMSTGKRRGVNGRRYEENKKGRAGGEKSRVKKKRWSRNWHKKWDEEERE